MLGGHRLGELFEVRLAQGLELVQILRPGVDRRVAPAGERLRRRLHRRVDILGGGQRCAADDVADRRVVDVEEIVAPGFDPAAADEVVEGANVRPFCDGHEGSLRKEAHYSYWGSNTGLASRA